LKSAANSLRAKPVEMRYTSQAKMTNFIEFRTTFVEKNKSVDFAARGKIGENLDFVGAFIKQRFPGD